MSAYTPSEIETMARTFTTKQAEALSAVELSFSKDGEIFEAVMDQLADHMGLREAAWDLFASTCRLQFYGKDASDKAREDWGKVAEAARDELYAEWLADARENAAADRADYYVDMAKEVAA